MSDINFQSVDHLCWRTRRHHVFRRAGICAAFLLLALCSGCTQLSLKTPKITFEGDDDPKTPTRMIPVWTDTTLTRAGKPGVRGFGGRLLFYETSDGQSVRVDGSIVVYAWDDTNTSSLDRVPDRKYVITAEELPRHFSDSGAGPSYSIWVPWDEIGGEHRKITLVTRFIGRNGAELTAPPSPTILPGPDDKTRLLEASMLVERERRAAGVTDSPSTFSEGTISHRTGIQQASWQTEATAPARVQNGTPERMETTTINVPSDFAERHLNVEQSSLDLNSVASRPNFYTTINRAQPYAASNPDAAQST